MTTNDLNHVYEDELPALWVEQNTSTFIRKYREIVVGESDTDQLKLLGLDRLR